jgi:hypothetical protein
MDFWLEQTIMDMDKVDNPLAILGMLKIAFGERKAFPVDIHCGDMVRIEETKMRRYERMDGQLGEVIHKIESGTKDLPTIKHLIKTAHQ